MGEYAENPVNIARRLAIEAYARRGRDIHIPP